jgi:hypothetical protein
MPKIVAGLCLPDRSPQAVDIGRLSEEISITHIAHTCALTSVVTAAAVSIPSGGSSAGLKRFEPAPSKVVQLFPMPVREVPLDEGLPTIAAWARCLIDRR